MTQGRRLTHATLLAVAVLALLFAGGCSTTDTSGGSESETEIAQPDLEPRYHAREPQPKPWYNSSYVFGMTRGVADSTIHPAVKGPLFIFTVPLDIVFLPFTAIGGLFG